MVNTYPKHGNYFSQHTSYLAIHYKSHTAFCMQVQYKTDEQLSEYDPVPDLGSTTNNKTPME